jgi:hypothetical protein
MIEQRAKTRAEAEARRLIDPIPNCGNVTIGVGANVKHENSYFVLQSLQLALSDYFYAKYLEQETKRILDSVDYVRSGITNPEYDE